MQNPNKEKPLQDQVVVLLDRTNSKPKQYPDNYPNPGDPNTPPPPYSDEKPPTSPTSTATRPLPFPKPKSRFVPSTYPHPRKLSDSDEPNAAAGEKLYSSDDGEDENDLFEDDDEEKQKKKYQRKKQKVGWRTITEWSTFVVLLACLITSLTKQPWNRQRLWGLMIWKWVLMVMVVFSGKLVSCWLVGLLAFVIERCFMLREKVVYFVYGLRKSVRNCIWLGLVLLSWYVMFNPEVEDSTNTHKFRKRVWRILMTGTIGAVIWLVKIILVKVLASSFHVHTFFDRMKLSVFHYVVMEKLSGTQPQPLDEVTRSPDQCEWKKRTGRAMPARMSRRIDMEKLRRLSRTNASAYTVKRLVSHVMYSGLSSMSRTVDKTMEDFKATGSDMKSELEARLCAKRIFNNVAKDGEK